MKKLYTIIFTLFAIVALSGCSGFVRKTVMETVDPYFHGPSIDGTAFEKVTDKVYTFHWNWYRNIVIVTNDGLVVIDPMNPEMASALHQELEKHFPGKKVNTLIYSHYHLDHTSGGAILAPENVIAHEKCPTYWNAVKHDGVLESGW